MADRLCVGGIALIAAGAWWWHARNARPMSDKDTVVVADFVNTTGDPVFDSTLKQALAVQLEQSPYLNMLSDQRIRSALRYMGRSPDERVTNTLAREICEREGYKAMLGGSIASLGRRYVIALNAVNCASGDALAQEQVEAEDKEHVLKALGTAASNIRAKLGESLASIQKMDMPLEDATTSSLDAFKAFALGEAQKNLGDDRGSMPFFQHAVELDPNFALAYGRLGVAYTNTGDLEQAREYYKKAFALINRVSERERLYITSHYYAGCTNESDKAIETLQLYRRTYPRDPSAANNLALEYERIGQFEKAAEGYQETIRLDPKMAIAYGNLAFVYVELDRFDEGKAICQRALAQGFDASILHGALLLIAYLQKDAPAIGREAIWFRGKPEEFHVKQGEAEARGAGGAMAQGGGIRSPSR